MEVQKNAKLRLNQERQFLEYSGNEDIVGQGMYDYINNRTFYWKNTDFSSHVIHPFMYNLKIWNKLNNIIVNGYNNYANSDLMGYLSSKFKFDDLFGEYGEGRNFWKYNVMDLSGYTTRYESSVKTEHKDDLNKTTSELTGYDGLFYPTAAQDYLKAYCESRDCVEFGFAIPEGFFSQELDVPDSWDMNLQDPRKCKLANPFIRAIYSIYWQKDNLSWIEVDSSGSTRLVSEDNTFYTKWYSHLNYTRVEYQRIAIQLWYWRSRLVELMTTNFPITKYCLDVQGNSIVMIQTFSKEDEQTNPYLIDLRIAQDRQVSSTNRNMHSVVCDNPLVKPSEMWIRWKSNPISLPALDVECDLKTQDEQFDKYYRNGEQIQLGQLTYANNDCNENFNLVVKDWIQQYRGIVSGNRLPVFFDMEQSANVLALATWKLTPILLEDGIARVDWDGNQEFKTSTGKNPFHILSLERPSENPSEYVLEEYGRNSAINSKLQGLEYGNYLFDAYHHCPANGSILLPTYEFDCIDSEEDFGEPEHQLASILMFVIPAQSIKSDNYVINEQIQELEIKSIDLNSFLPQGEDMMKWRFDGPIKVCRNTNLVFSPYEDRGLNKVKCAFLGNFPSELETRQFKVNCGMAKTRYGFDSKSPLDTSQLKQRYFRGDDGDWRDESGRKVSPSEVRRYVDSGILNKGYNSYDSLDKYVMVLDFDSPLDNKTLFDLSSIRGLKTYSFNILSDAGFIPSFACQSLVKYGDKEGGITKTWMSKHLKDKSHMQFQLLGMDDCNIAQAYGQIQRLVVKDTTDDCDTLVNPMKLVDGIYRIWCEVKGSAGKEQGRHAFASEFQDYSNRTIEFNDHTEATWSPDESELFEVDPERIDDYYVSVLRTENANILNERRYLLKPFKVSGFLMEVESDEHKYMKCNLGKWHSSGIKDNHFVTSQAIFAGTTNPFNYDKDGERVFSIQEELQYGNSICGVGQLHIKVEKIDKEVETWEVSGHTKTGKCTWRKKKVSKSFLKPTLKFTRFQVDESRLDEPSLEDKVQLQVTKVDSGLVTVVFSRKNPEDIAKYHILNRCSSLYYNGSLPKSYMIGSSIPDSSGSDLDPYWMNDPSHWEWGDNNPPDEVSGNRFKFSDFKFNRTLTLKEYTKKLDDGKRV